MLAPASCFVPTHSERSEPIYGDFNSNWQLSLEHLSCKARTSFITISYFVLTRNPCDFCYLPHRTHRRAQSVPFRIRINCMQFPDWFVKWFKLISSVCAPAQPAVAATLVGCRRAHSIQSNRTRIVWGRWTGKNTSNTQHISSRTSFHTAGPLRATECVG